VAAMLLTSASSRTALTAAFAAKHHAVKFKVLGLTSAGNREFVTGTGLYDHVYTYDEVSSIVHTPGDKIAVFDMAGSSTLEASIRAHFKADVAVWGGVGKTHVGEGGGFGGGTDTELHGGAKGAMFSVFAALASKSYGKAKVGQMQSDALEAFVAWKLPHFKSVKVFGGQATLNMWQATVESKVDPATTLVCSLWPTPAQAELEPGASKL